MPDQPATPADNTPDDIENTELLDPRLAQRVEEASMNAWPAQHQLLLDGWMIRLSNGFTKRANCVVPLYPTSDRVADSVPGTTSVRQYAQLDKIRYCENLYAREQLNTVFRLTSHASNNELDRVLEERGYLRLDETCVQVKSLTATRRRDQTGKLRLVTAPDWLAEYGRLANMPDTARDKHAELIRAIQPDCAFALLEHNTDVVACALGVLEHDLFGLFDVITAEHARGRGHAGELLSALLTWGAQKGARLAYLQVVANNTPARALYARHGFADLYRYWYRQTG